MKRIILSIIVALAFFVGIPASAGIVIKGSGHLQLEVDIARFFGDSTQTYVEVYYALHENNITYRSDSGRYIGAANMKLVVRNDSSIFVSKDWTVPHVLADTASLTSGQKMVGIETFGLHPGSYTVILTAYDVYDALRQDSLQIPLVIDGYPATNESLSDIELCTSIQSSTNRRSMFYKNTLEVIPNASRLYGAGLPVVFYYVEAYNLASDQQKPNMTVHTSVIDATGKELIAKDKSKPRAHNSSVEVGTINISTLRSGTYLLRITLVDSGKTTLASASKKIFIYKPGAIPADSSSSLALNGVSSSEFAAMSDTMLDQQFDRAKYIASPAELLQYKRIVDLRAKQNYLFEFWQRRNPNPLSPVNDFKDEYMRRLDYADKNFTFGFHEGWKTERGRVYIVYGPCDEVERFPSSSESNPYEIWHFNNIQGGVIFVFVDRTGLGDYQLVHSTHRDEIRDEQWYEEYAQKMR